MLLARLRPAAAPGPPHASLVAWIAVAVVLGLVVLGGLMLASRR